MLKQFCVLTLPCEIKQKQKCISTIVGHQKNFVSMTCFLSRREDNRYRHIRQALEIPRKDKLSHTLLVQARSRSNFYKLFFYVELRMFVKVLFFLLPVVLRASHLCDGDECDARYARIAAGDNTEPNTRPFQVRNHLRLLL